MESSRDVVYYFTIRKPGSQEKWKTGIMEKPCYGFRVTKKRLSAERISVSGLDMRHRNLV
jgi:hypothetical protein